MREESVKFLPQPISSVWVRDPKMQKNDFWNAYIDYEVCLQTNSVCFTKKISSVRRRYSEFVWLRQKLQENSMLMVELPALPPKTPFFSMNNARQVSHRMKGLQRFLEQILQSAQLLSDSCLHLFLQSQLSVAKMEACAAGRTHYSVAQAVSCCGLRRFHSEEELHKHLDVSCDSESDCSDCKHPEDQNENSSEEKAEEPVLFDLLQNSQEETLSCSSGST